jgi:FkbM family methyltransferase
MGSAEGRSRRWIDSLRHSLSPLLEDIVYSNVLANPIDFLVGMRSGGARRIVFRNGPTLMLDVSNKEGIAALVALAYHGQALGRPDASHWDAWTFSEDCQVVTTPSGLRFRVDSLSPTIFLETFAYDMHFQDFELQDRVIVDAGANVGDTALYFAQRGAKVIALEPDPQNFHSLKENLALNPGLSSRVLPLNVALGVDGTISFRSGLGGGSGVNARGGTSIQVRSVSLRTLLDQTSTPDGYLLKMDCKGSEFQVVAQREIRRFKRVAIEYSVPGTGGSLDRLIDELRADGFSRFRAFKHRWGPIRLSDYGMLVAE